MSAPVRQSDFIGELCMALRHDWLPDELFVIFTAYFDETDVHGPAPTIIMSAYLGHAYQWRRFEKKLARIQEAEGFKIFHATDFVGNHGEFSGWDAPKSARTINALTDLVKYNLTEGLSVFLEHDRYMKEYRAPPIPRKMRLDSQYGVCFRACLGRIFQVLEEQGRDARLHVVMERGHRNVWDCERIFNDMKAALHRDGTNFLGDFTVAKKEEAHPLMVADMLAYAHSRLRTAIHAGATDPRTPDANSDAAKAMPGRLVFLELGPDALREMKEQYAERRQRQHEHAVAEHQARRAARAASRGQSA